MLTHCHISCYREGCFAVITLHPDEERRLRRTQETFYCPAGHAQHFLKPEETDDQKRIRQLERRLERWAESNDRTWALVRTLDEKQRSLVRGLNVCPLGCGWSTTRRLAGRPTQRDVARFLDRVGADLADHLLSEHNATRAPVALLGTGGAS